MFQLTPEEGSILRFEIGMSKGKGRGGRRYLPYVFTEQGVTMLSSVLRGKRAVQVNVEIMRALVRYAACLLPTKIWPESSLLWKRNTMRSLELFSSRFGSSGPNQFGVG
jgi:hypothetical protein